MRMAGRFSRRLRAWAKANNVPVVYCAAGERKHEIAEEHLSTRQVKPGLFLGTRDDQDEWASTLRRAGDPERSRICGGTGAKSQSRIHQTGELPGRCRALERSWFAYVPSWRDS